MRLRAQLLLGFLSLAVVMLVMGGYSIFSLYQLKLTTEDLYNGPLMAINFARSAQFNISQIEGHLADLRADRPREGMPQDRPETKVIVEKIDALREIFDEDLNIVKERIGGAEGQTAIAQIRAAAVAWDEAWQQWMTARTGNDRMQLGRIEGEAAAAIDTIEGELEVLVELAAQDVYNFLEAANAQSAWKIRRNIGLVGLVGGGGVVAPGTTGGGRVRCVGAGWRGWGCGAGRG